MKIECKKNKLLKVLSKADRVVSKNPSLPVLSSIVFETGDNSIIVKSTDLEVGFRGVIPAKIHSKGEFAVSSNLLVSYLSSLNSDDDLILELKENTLSISGNNSETQINTFSTEDFPTIPDTSSGTVCKIPSKELIEGFKSVWYAASLSSMKPELSSVYIYKENDKLCFVATDSFRLAEKTIKVKINDFENVLIPQKNVFEISRIFEDIDEDVEIRFDEDKISFSVKGDFYIVTRVIDGNFPDYKQIIPKESTTKVTVLKNDLINTFKISNLFLNNFNQVSFSINEKDEIFEITSKNTEKGESRNIVKASVIGESVQINFNQKYITDSFASIKPESVVLEFNGVGKPMIIRGVGDDSFKYLVMPLNK